MKGSWRMVRKFEWQMEQSVSKEAQKVRIRWSTIDRTKQKVSGQTKSSSELNRNESEGLQLRAVMWYSKDMKRPFPMCSPWYQNRQQSRDQGRALDVMDIVRMCKDKSKDNVERGQAGEVTRASERKRWNDNDIRRRRQDALLLEVMQSNESLLL